MITVKPQASHKYIRYFSCFVPNFVSTMRFVLFSHDYFGLQLKDSISKGDMLRIGYQLDLPRSIQYSNVTTYGTVIHDFRDSVPVLKRRACC